MARNTRMPDDVAELTAAWKRHHDEMERGVKFVGRGEAKTKPKAELRASRGGMPPQTLATALGAEVDPMEVAKKGYRAIANREIDDPLISPGIARFIGAGLAGYQGLEAAGGAIGGGPRGGNAAPRLPRGDSTGALTGANTPVYIVRGAPMSTLKYLTEPGETLRMPSFAVVADSKGSSIAGGAGVDTGGLRIFMKPDYFLRPGTRAVLTKGDGWTEMGGGGTDRPANMRLADMLERLEKASHVNPDTFMADGVENLVSRMYRHRRTPIFDEGPDGVPRSTGDRLNTPAEAYRLARADLEAEFEAGRSAIQSAPKVKTIQNARRVAARERDEAQADAFRKAQTAEGVINPDVARSGKIILNPEDKTFLVAPELLRQRNTNYHELKAYQDVDPSDIYAVALDVSAPGVTRASVEEAKRSLESKGLRVVLYYPKTVDQYLATKGIKSKAAADAFISDVMDLEHADTLDERNAAFQRRYAPGGPNPRFPEAFDEETMTRLISRDIMFQEAAKGGDTPRNVRAAEGGGDTPGASETAVSETPVSENPAQPSGPRIVVNPKVFTDRRDALCVAFNEAFRVVMEMNGFEPVSEPTEAQRKFFADTAYANDELQLRRTILARIATLDTSVKDPTDEQLEETMEMLEMVMEVGAPQNEWEQQAVQRLHDVVAKSLESTRANGTARQPEPPEDEASAQAAVGGGITDEEEWKDGDVRYVEKDGSYYRQTYRQGESAASSGWQGAAIGKDEWDSAQRNIEKGVSAQRFAEAWDAGTEDWNKQQKEIRGLMDENTEAHNEVNRMVANGTITPERGQWAHSTDSSDYDTSGWTWRSPESGKLLTYDARDIRDIFGGDPKRRGAIGFQHGGDRGLLNQTRTLDLDLNEDELAKKATSSALAGLANMEPDKSEPQAAGLAGTEPEKAPEKTPEAAPVPSGTGMAGIPSGTGGKPPETAVAGAPGTSTPNWANGAVVGKDDPEAFGRTAPDQAWANGMDVSEYKNDPEAFGTEAPGTRGVAMPKPVEAPKLNWRGLASRTDARGRYFDSDGRVITKRQAERMERKKRKELGLA